MLKYKMIKINFKTMAQIVKKYAPNILLVMVSLYMAPCIYNVFNNNNKELKLLNMIQVLEKIKILLYSIKVLVISKFINLIYYRHNNL